MFAFSSIRPPASAPTLVWGRRVAALITSAAGALAREARIRRDLRIVSGLNDGMLRDIGVARGELERAVRHGREGGAR